MASIFNPNVFTFSAEQIRDLAQLLFENTINGDDFRPFHTIIPGIVTDKEVGFVGDIGPVGKAGQGCSPTWTSMAAPTRKVTWSPKIWEIPIAICATDMENQISTYSRKWGLDPDNIEGTDYQRIAYELLDKAVKKMFWRLIWFGDVDAANFNDSPAGVITNGLDVDYVNLFDGFWKQIFDQCTTNPLQKVAIAANSQATYALQKSELTPILAYETFENMILNAPLEVRQMPASEIIIYSTLHLYDKAKQHLFKGANGYIMPVTESLGYAMNGMQDLMINGYRIIALPIFSQLIDEWENSGTAWNLPHRAVMTTKENLQVGVPSTDAVSELSFNFDFRTRENLFHVKDKLDVKIPQPQYLMSGY